MPNKATSISTVLANKTFSHSLTLKDITKPILTTDPFIYTLNTPGMYKNVLILIYLKRFSYTGSYYTKQN